MRTSKVIASNYMSLYIILHAKICHYLLFVLLESDTVALLAVLFYQNTALVKLI